MRLEVVDEFVEIVGLCPYFASKYHAFFLYWWTNIIVGRLKELSYKNIWSSWIQRNMSPNIVSKGCKFPKYEVRGSDEVEGHGELRSDCRSQREFGHHRVRHCWSFAYHLLIISLRRLCRFGLCDRRSAELACQTKLGTAQEAI